MINQNFTSIQQMQGAYLKNNPLVHNQEKRTSSFEEILKTKAGIAEEEQLSLKFSKHAGARLADRNISLTQEQLGRLEEGARKAGEKGIQESLVLMDGLAFIVNVKNKTVITAMDSSESKDNVYTNIDGAVII